jgi:hypothetical protein
MQMKDVCSRHPQGWDKKNSKRVNEYHEQTRLNPYVTQRRGGEGKRGRKGRKQNMKILGRREGRRRERGGKKEFCGEMGGMGRVLLLSSSHPANGQLLCFPQLLRMRSIASADFLALELGI